jgi:enoyl-CoA hydratase
MEYKTLDLAITNGVAHIKLNRPDKLNTMIPEFWSEIIEVCERLDETPEVRVTIISSTGRYFTAGMDVSVFQNWAPDLNADPARNAERTQRTVVKVQQTFNAIAELRMPVLVAIQGGCLGGGVDLISSCDMRYCTEDATFCIQEINIGIAADAGTLQRLPKLIPLGIMKELAYTGRRLNAEEAKECGLVNRVYQSHEEMLEDVERIAIEITKRSPMGIYGSKKAIDFAIDHTISESLDQMAILQSGMVSFADVMTALQAQATKTEPDFRDLLTEPVKIG